MQDSSIIFAIAFPPHLLAIMKNWVFISILLLGWCTIVAAQRQDTAGPDNLPPFTAQVDTVSSYVGIGVIVKKDFETTWLLVESLLTDGPAHRTGIREGDYITRINDQPTRKLSLEDMARMLIGQEGSSVDLIVMRDHNFFPVTVTREAITF